MSNTKTKFREVKGWDVSTAHLTEADNDLMVKHIEDCILANISVDQTSYGYLIYPTQYLTVETAGGMSEHFVKIYNDAIDSGIEWLRFDCDASKNPDYPTFDW